MLFNSYIFIFVFLPIVLGGYLVLRKNAQSFLVPWLVLASLVYYAWWNPKLIFILLGSVAFNFLFGKLLLRHRTDPAIARTLLITGITFNLGLLAYFKYMSFFLTNVNDLFSLQMSVPKIVLPIGISFITFQKIAFLVDVYKGVVKNFTLMNYSLFVTFFPQLIAGPIVHHSEIIPQMGQQNSRNVREDLSIGSTLFIIGLFKKVVIADGFALYANAGYETLRLGHSLSAASGWVSVLSYSFQIYFDFSGYSDMAIGLARMFGYQLPVNFYSPYKSSGIIEFWRRWHITLSRFMRDYLYVPLGGNQLGLPREFLNLCVVMLLGGLWHGANWTFILWGGIHGAMLVTNHGWHKVPLSSHRYLRTALARACAVIGTFTCVTLAWIPFRADSISQASKMLSTLIPTDRPGGWDSFGQFFHAQFTGLTDPAHLMSWFTPRELWPPILPPNFLASSAQPVGLLLLGGICATFVMPNVYQIFMHFDPALGLSGKPAPSWGRVKKLYWPVAFWVAFMFFLSVLRLSHVSPFLYFQF